MKQWIRINSKRNRGEIIEGNKYNEILFDNFEKKKTELEREGYDVLVSGDVYGFTKDADTKAWLLTRGFTVQSEGEKEEEAKEKTFSAGATTLIEANPNVDFSSLVGTGKGGRVLKGDVENYLENLENLNG